MDTVHVPIPGMIPYQSVKTSVSEGLWIGYIHPFRNDFHLIGEKRREIWYMHHSGMISTHLD